MAMIDRPPRLCRYRNGNYAVWLYADGTKIKHTDADFFDAEFPDSIDLKITDRCDMACPMCHESSTASGAHGDLSAPFLDSLHAGQELALGGGNALTHPDLDGFLARMKARGVICNLTVNEAHLLRELPRVQRLLDDKLVYGLGVSPVECAPQTIDFARRNASTVFHLICGIADETVFDKLADKGLKILLLGYKKRGRGAAYYSADVERNIAWTEKNLMALCGRFDTVCFDNAALVQLDVAKKLPRALFEARYMGDDGTASMYIDAVRGEYAVSSTSAERFPVCGSVEDMFADVKRRRQNA